MPSTNLTLGARIDNAQVVPQKDTNSSGTNDTSPEVPSHEQLEILQIRPEISQLKVIPSLLI